MNPAQHQGRRSGFSARSRGPWSVGIAVFALAFLLRILFWQATPDADWPYSSYYRGDALSWLQYADALHRGLPFHDNLPTWPPGMAYLVALIWDGTAAGIVTLKLAWCFLGALTVGLFCVAVHRFFGLVPSVLAGLAAACSTGLFILSTSINNETPYLLLVLISFLLLPRSREPASAPRIAAWSVVHALACLMRAEHALFYVLCLGFLVVTQRAGIRAESGREPSRPASRAGKRKRRRDRASSPSTNGLMESAVAWKRALLTVTLSLLFFVVPLIPWQILVHANIERFNTNVRPSDAGLSPSARETEGWIADIAWDDAAVREREKLPGFVRRLAGDFVAATVKHRNGTRVRAEDLQILKEAFGYVPEPMRTVPFITSIGPLNFYLSNNPHATAGFSRRILDDPPPLEGGSSRFYKDLLLTPPRSGTLYIDYPPHLRAYIHGYALGWRWIQENPVRFLGLVRDRLWGFWSGASLGFTGYGLPNGVSGVQRAVDIVVPISSPITTAWKLLLVAVCLAGILAEARRPEIYPWLLFFLSKIVVVCFFFGFARIGATVLPVVFLLGALAIQRWIFRRISPGNWSGPKGSTRVTRILLVLALALAVVESVRLAGRPEVWIDSEKVESTDPFPGTVHRDRTVQFR